MVILDILSLELDNDNEHIATDWEVSDDISFRNILLSSYENYKDKKTIIFPNNLDVDRTYYGRARALLKTGWTEWGNVDIFKAINNIDLKPQDIFPTRVSIPRINTYRMVTDTGYDITNTIDYKPNPDTNNPNHPDILNKDPHPDNVNNVGANTIYSGNNVDDIVELIDPNHHDISLFTIKVEGYQVIGNAKHIATSYWIENRDGDVVWSSLLDRYNLHSIHVKDVFLKKDQFYRIRVTYHTNSNDVSQIGTYSLVTGQNENIKLLSYLDQVNHTIDNELYLEYRPGVNDITWEILQYNLGNITSVWSNRTSTIKTVIPKNTLTNNGNYVLRIRTNQSDTYTYIPFITSSETPVSSNDPATYLLVYPDEITMYVGETADVFIETDSDDTVLTYSITDAN